jgi:hypothetical protein
MRRRMSRRGNVAHTAGDFAALLHEPGSVCDRRQVLPRCSNRALLEWGRAAANCQPRFRTGCRSSSPTRYRRIRTEPSDPAIAVAQATVLMGPALILTALVLACGLAALVFSNLPTLRLFGWLGAFAMLAALVADLLILRPVVTFLLRLGRRTMPLGGSAN